MRKKLLFIIFCLSALTGFAQTANTHPQADDLKGKRIGVIGDSYVKNHKEPVENTWHYAFAQKHGMEYFNYGRNGNSIAYSSPRWGEAMYIRYKKMADNLDYVIVIGGHNDAFKLDSIGGIDNFKAKLEILCKGLVEKYPTCLLYTSLNQDFRIFTT